MTVRKRIRWLALTAMIIAGIVSSMWLIEDRQYAAKTQRQNDLVASRADCLSDLKAALGYGGLIHTMKNYVLRGDAEYIASFDASHASAIRSIDRYESLPEVTPLERTNLLRVRSVVDDYRAAMDRAVAIRTSDESARTPAGVLDAQVRVEDAGAFLALSVLDEHRAMLSGAITDEINTIRRWLGLTKLGIAVAGLGIFLFLSRRLTRPITSPMIKTADGGEIDAASAARLLVRHEELRAILDTLPAYIYFKDARNTILNLNKAAADTIGLPVEEIIGKNATEFFPAADAARFLVDDLNVIGSGTPKLGIEEMHTTEPGGTRCIVTDKIPLVGEDGTVDRLVAIATDVTDIKQAQAQIDDMHKLLDQSLRHAKQGGWSWNIPKNEVQFSESWYTMLGYEPFEMPMSYETWQSLVHPDDAERATAALADHVAGKSGTYDLAIRMLRKDGSWNWIRTIGEIAERDHAGVATNVAGMHLDIDKERRLSEQLRQKTEEMERFVYTASHDLKSPVVTVLGFLSHLERSLETGETENAARYIGILKSAGKQMQSNVEDILEISRLGRMSVIPTPVDFADAVREVGAVRTDDLEKANARIALDLGTPTIWCDRRHIVSVLDNFIGNAIKYAASEQGLVITIRTRRTPDGGVRLDVHDNGPGIDPAYATKIFQLFERLSTDKDGSGVGLAIVSRIAEVWGGKAWLEPTEKGACFSMTFPTASPTKMTIRDSGKESAHDHRRPADHQTVLAG